MAAFKMVTKDFQAIDGKHYYIVETGRRYGVIPHELMVDGKLSRPVFGGEMLLSETVSELIQRVGWRVKVDRWVAEGYDREAAAIAAVTDMNIKEAQELWNKNRPVE